MTNTRISWFCKFKNVNVCTNFGPSNGINNICTESNSTIIAILRMLNLSTLSIPSAIFCSLDNICASFCCLSANSPRPLKSTRNNAIMESTIWRKRTRKQEWWCHTVIGIHNLEGRNTEIGMNDCFPTQFATSQIASVDSTL